MSSASSLFGGMGGMSCPLSARAYTDPHAAMPERK